MGFGGREGGGSDTDRETGSGSGQDSAVRWSELSPLVVNTPSAGTASPVDVAGFAEAEHRTTVASSTSACATTSTVAGVELRDVDDLALAPAQRVVPFTAAGGTTAPGGSIVAIVEEEAPDCASIAAQ